jgi:hypothetical protein
MTSDTAVWKPSATETQKKVSGPNEVTALSLKSGAGPAVISIYDATDVTGVNDTNLKWVLDSAAAGNDNQSFLSPIIFRKGIFAVCEQGPNFNPIFCLAARKYAGI